MIEVLPAPAHVAAFRITGTLTVGDYDRCITEVEARLEAHERMALFCDLTGMRRIALAALARDLRFALELCGQSRRFARSALVTERAWLARLTRFAARFFPRTEVRVFAPAERAIALAWASVPLPGT